MESRIKEYIDQAFTSAPDTRKTMELKEELIANMTEKYRDQLELGKSPEEAYKSVIAGVGNIDELVDGVRDRQSLVLPTAKERSKNAMMVAIAVGLYIMSPVALIYFAEVRGSGVSGVTAFLFLVAVATGLLVYNGMSKPRYMKEEETLVEEFKEWQSTRNHEKKIEGSLTSAFWLVVVAVYLLLSFQFGAWAYSWIIFIIAAAVHNILKAIIGIRRSKK